MWILMVDVVVIYQKERRITTGWDGRPIVRRIPRSSANNLRIGEGEDGGAASPPPHPSILVPILGNQTKPFVDDECSKNLFKVKI